MDTLEVPEELIAVEEPLSHFRLKTRKRADIVILSEDIEQPPLTVIECKADNISLDENSFDVSCSMLISSFFEILSYNSNNCIQKSNKMVKCCDKRKGIQWLF